MSDTQFASLKVWRISLPLRLAFSHNLAARSRADALVVELTTADGHSGYGQALPRPYLTGETMESAAEGVVRHWLRLSAMRLPPFSRLEQAVAALTPLFREADENRLNASYAAVDIAALDAIARENGFSAAMGRFDPRSRMELTAVIPAASPGKAAWLARILKWLGYRRFKVKVGKDADADRRRFEAVRKAAGAGAWLAVDANQAWDVDEAVARMARLGESGVRLVEEPLVREAARTANFAELEKETGVAVMADESLCTVRDARALLDRGSCSWWNIRLAKNGGMTGAAHFYRLARENGIKIYGGILVGETGVMAAAAQRSLFGNNPVCAEYGFPRVFLRGDPFRGGPWGYFGGLPPPDAARHGLGVTIKRDLLSRNGILLHALTR